MGAQPDQQPPTPRGTGVDTRPPATLYIHLSHHSFSRDATGVARFEGEGPVTVDQVKRWLGSCQVTVKPVIDLANQAPVDGYEIPDRLREATHLRNPVDLFPYATNTSRRKDIDHTIAYLDPGDGGPPGQTALETSDRWSDSTTASRPTPTGKSNKSSTASSSGDHPTATTTSSTTPAPNPSGTAAEPVPMPTS